MIIVVFLHNGADLENVSINFEELLVNIDGLVKFLKVDVDRNLEIANKYNVVNIPTMVILKHGVKRDVVTDFSPKRRKLKKILKNIYKRRD